MPAVFKVEGIICIHIMPIVAAVVSRIFPFGYKEVRDVPKKDDLQKTQSQADAKTERRKRDEYLTRKAREGDTQAREALIIEHLYLVHNLVGLHAGKGVPTDVLFQEGCYGLILAVDRYDPNQNASLDTYASYYVNKYLWQAMLENYPHPIILKQKSSKWVKRYRAATERLTEELGRAPSNQEVADALDISYQAAASLLFGSMPAFSLDNMSAKDYTPSASMGRPAEEETLDILNEMCLDDFPVSLTPIEEEILYLRFGFGPDCEPKTFIQIGQKFNLSAETISSYYSRAIQKLKDAANSSL